MTDNSITVKLIPLNCCECGLQFTIPESLYKYRQKDGKKFFCPNGHSQVFTCAANNATPEFLQAELDAAQTSIAEKDKKIEELNSVNSNLLDNNFSLQRQVEKLEAELILERNKKMNTAQELLTEIYQKDPDLYVKFHQASGWRGLLDPFCDEWQRVNVETKANILREFLKYTTFPRLVDLYKRLWDNSSKREYIIKDMPFAILQIGGFLPEAKTYFEEYCQTSPYYHWAF